MNFHKLERLIIRQRHDTLSENKFSALLIQFYIQQKTPEPLEFPIMTLSEAELIEILNKS
jgi:hypothetical protein